MASTTTGRAGIVPPRVGYVSGENRQKQTVAPGAVAGFDPASCHEWCQAIQATHTREAVKNDSGRLKHPRSGRPPTLSDLRRTLRRCSGPCLVVLALFPVACDPSDAARRLGLRSHPPQLSTGAYTHKDHKPFVFQLCNKRRSRSARPHFSLGAAAVPLSQHGRPAPDTQAAEPESPIPASTLIVPSYIPGPGSRSR